MNTELAQTLDDARRLIVQTFARVPFEVDDLANDDADLLQEVWNHQGELLEAIDDLVGELRRA